jgi:hypothetical protein
MANSQASSGPRKKAACAASAQLQTQRQLVAQQLGDGAASNGSYPRSATMRLLTHQPELVVLAIGALARLFRGR